MTQRQFHLPTNDIIFHCLFGTKGQERITKDFLESLLKKEIEDIDLDANLEFIRSYYEDKLQIADVVAKDVNKNKYIIEMQNRKYGYLPQRFLSSACKAYITQLKASDKYEKLKKIAIVIIMLEKFPKIENIDKYHTIWNFREQLEKDKILTDDIEIHIIEIPKYLKQKEKHGIIEPWLEFLVNPKGEEVQEAMKEYKTIQEAVDELNRLNENDEVRMLADLQLFAKLDRNSQLAEMREEGLELGRREGLEIGKAEGIEIGKAEGREEGRKEQKKDIAKKMLELKIDMEIIMNTTGLSKEQIEELNA